MSTIEKALAKKRQSSKNANENEEGSTIVETTSDDGANTITSPKTLTIDKTGLDKRGYLIDTGSRQCIKDELREIKRKLLSNAFGNGAKLLDHPNLIMVSSAKPNEGKTFVSINLALSIALEKDKTVLLVDSDVLRPSVSRELGIEQTEGLIEYLLKDDTAVSDIMFNTNIDNLKLIPAGKPHHLSNELLASEKMAALANELATRYPDRIVIFDCPPLVGVTETLVLANLVGQALVVVEESKTSIASIKAATEHLNENLAIGIVMNKAIRSHKDLYGYYGYGYGEN